MAKIAVVAVIAIGAYLIFRPGGASADEVTCLLKSGATVAEKRLLDGAENLPIQVKNRLLELEKRNYDVQVGDDFGVLIVARSAKSAEEVRRSLVAGEGPDTAHRAGAFVMYWPTVPSGHSAGIVHRCLH